MTLNSKIWVAADVAVFSQLPELTNRLQTSQQFNYQLWRSTD